jgi:hypothetical protein
MNQNFIKKSEKIKNFLRGEIGARTEKCVGKDVKNY